MCFCGLKKKNGDPESHNKEVGIQGLCVLQRPLDSSPMKFIFSFDLQEWKSVNLFLLSPQCGNW